MKAVNTDGVGGRSRYLNVTTGAALAPAPQELSVSLSGGVFTVTWSGVVGAERYVVEYRTGTGDGTTYAAVLGEPSDVDTVTTERCNDPPEFTSSNYTFLVLEDAATSTVVGTVTATDADRDTVTYTITSGNGDGRFAIATSTGEITLASPLVAAAGTTYSLSVEARDGYGGAASAGVTVTVAAVTCSGGIAVPDPDGNPGLVSDCETLLSMKDALAGTGTLNWSGATVITGWDGVTVGGTPKRVTELNLRNRGLTGVIPPGLGDSVRSAGVEPPGEPVDGRYTGGVGRPVQSGHSVDPR